MPHKYIEGIEQINPHEFGGMCSRAAALQRKEVDWSRGIDTVATTDAPVLVIDWERWQVIREILPMRYAEMPNGDKAPLLDSHSRWSVNQVMGSAKNWKTEGSELLATIFVSESEEKTRQKIEEGHIDSVSIGYETDKNYSVEVPKKAEVIIDGTSYRNDFEDDYPLIVRTWWRTHELSLVPIGADEAAKFKSVADQTVKRVMDKIGELEREIQAMKTREVPPTGKSKALYERKLKRIQSDLTLY